MLALHGEREANEANAVLKKRLETAEDAAREANLARDNAFSEIGRLSESLRHSKLAVMAARKDQQAAWHMVERLDEASIDTLSAGGMHVRYTG